MRRVTYFKRLNNIKDLDFVTLPTNSFTVYIQTTKDTMISESSPKTIYSFENGTSRIFISSRRILEMSIDDYSSLTSDSEISEISLKDLVKTTIKENQVENIKMLFIGYSAV